MSDKIIWVESVRELNTKVVLENYQIKKVKAFDEAIFTFKISNFTAVDWPDDIQIENDCS